MVSTTASAEGIDALIALASRLEPGREAQKRYWMPALNVNETLSVVSLAILP